VKRLGIGIAFVLGAALVGGCTRQVVLEPHEIASIDKGRWVVLEDPSAGAAPLAAPGGEAQKPAPAAATPTPGGAAPR